ncbi:hypothetical protein ABZV14_44605 [Streptosporangium canum]|uniref:hypothetical protein n=1 Tax=Streptosporangium canum TaxID=324952 RepID=UPI0033B2F469
MPELNQLQELQERFEGEFIADGFELIGFGEPRHGGRQAVLACQVTRRRVQAGHGAPGRT